VRDRRNALDTYFPVCPCRAAFAERARAAIDLATRIPEWREAGLSREHNGRALAERLRSSARRVALVDVGFLAYQSGVEVIDLGGITEPAIARLPGGHLDKRVREAWLAERAPDALVLHSSRPPLVAADARLLDLSGYPVEQRIAGWAGPGPSSAWRSSRPTPCIITTCSCSAADAARRSRQADCTPHPIGGTLPLCLRNWPWFLVASADPARRELPANGGAPGRSQTRKARWASWSIGRRVRLPGMLEALGLHGPRVAPPDAPVLVGGPVAPDTGWLVFEQTPERSFGDEVVRVSDRLAVSASRDCSSKPYRARGPSA
jgi:hypothetical protein